MIQKTISIFFVLIINLLLLTPVFADKPDDYKRLLLCIEAYGASDSAEKEIDAILNRYPEAINNMGILNENAKSETSLWETNPLYIAVNNKNIKLVRYLVKKGADINIYDNICLIAALDKLPDFFYSLDFKTIDMGKGALFQEVYSGISEYSDSRTIEVIDTLLSRGTPITPEVVGYFVDKNDVARFKYVLDNGFDFNNTVIRDGYSLVELVVLRSRPELLKILIEKNADLSKVNLSKSLKGLAEYKNNLKDYEKDYNEQDSKTAKGMKIEETRKNIKSIEEVVKILKENGIKDLSKVRLYAFIAIDFLVFLFSYLVLHKKFKNKIAFSLLWISWAVTIVYSLLFLKVIGITIIVLSVGAFCSINLAEKDETTAWAAKFHPESLFLIFPTILGVIIYNTYIPISEYFFNYSEFSVGWAGITGYIIMLFTSIGLAINQVVNEN